jgi:heat shock protein HslJ
MSLEKPETIYFLNLMKTITTNTLLLSAAIALSLVSCNKQDDVAPQNQNSSSEMRKTASAINNTKWEFSNYAINKITLTKEQEATIEFSNLMNNKMNVSGRSFINFYAGTVTIDDSKGVFTYFSGMTTLMGGDEATMKLESDFTSNLEKATYFETQGSQLTLYLGEKSNSKTERMLFIKK